MKTFVIVSFWFIVGFHEPLFTQEPFKVNCLIFDTEDEFIEIKVNEEALLTTFSIVRKKYETKESREIALQEYRQKSLTGIPFPDLNFAYTTFKKPEEIGTLNEIECDNIYYLQQVRKNEHLLTHNMVFILKLEEGSYRIWNVRKWTY